MGSSPHAWTGRFRYEFPRLRRYSHFMMPAGIAFPGGHGPSEWELELWTIRRSFLSHDGLLSSIAKIRLGMFPMNPPILKVLFHHRLVANYEQVFRIPLLRCPREIKAARYDNFTINNDDLIVSDVVCRIYPDRDTRLCHKRARRILSRQVTLVQDDLYGDSPFLGPNKSLGDGGGGKRVGLHENGRSG